MTEKTIYDQIQELNNLQFELDKKRNDLQKICPHNETYFATRIYPGHRVKDVGKYCYDCGVFVSGSRMVRYHPSEQMRKITTKTVK